MSSNTTNIIPVSLEGQLNLNSFKAPVKEFKDWNKKNGLNYGGLLSPFYNKSEDNTDGVQFIDSNGNQYYMDGADFCKKDTDGNVTTIKTFSAGKFERKVLGNNENESMYSWEYDEVNDIFYWVVRDSATQCTLYNSYNDYTVTLTGTFGTSIFYNPILKVNPNNNYLYVIYCGSSTILFEVVDVLNETCNSYSYSTSYTYKDNTSCVFFDVIYGTSTECIVISTRTGVFLAQISGQTLTNIGYVSSVYVITTEEELSIANDYYYITQDGKVHYQKALFDSSGQFVTNTICARLYQFTYSSGTYKIYCNYPIGASSYITADNLDTSIFSSTYGAEINVLTDIYRTNIKLKNITVLAAKTTIANSGKYYAATTCLKANQYLLKSNPLFDIDENDNISCPAGENWDYTKFRFLYNNDTLTGISGIPQEGNTYQGILLTPWFSIKQTESVTDNNIIIVSDTHCIYEDEDYNLIALIYSADNPDIIGVLENRYILFNTDSIYNVYDIKLDKFTSFASDWNNRLGDATQVKTNTITTIAMDIKQISQSEAFTSDTTNLEIVEACCDYRYVASGVNVFFETSNNPFISMLLNPIGGFCTDLTNLTITKLYTNSIARYYGIKMYCFLQSNSDDNTCYNEYGDAYPLTTSSNILLNMPLFFDIYDSGINLNLISIDDKTYVQYSYNNKLMYAYYLLSQIDNLTAVFVLYGQIYGILNNKIVALTVNDGVFSSSEFIVNVNNLQFVGATPYQAFFYSPFNRSVYVFTGDRQLSLLFNATALTEISEFWYNPSNNALFWNTNLGLIIIENNEACLLEISDINNIYFLEDHFIVVTDSEILMYSKNALTGYTVENLDLETAYFGTSETMLGIIDTWYIRLVSTNHDAGTVTLSVKTWTDTGTETEDVTVDISADDWDELTDSYYLRYQPAEQRAVGTCLAINSPFAIESLSASYTQDTVMNSSNNA